MCLDPEPQPIDLPTENDYHNGHLPEDFEDVDAEPDDASDDWASIE